MHSRSEPAVRAAGRLLWSPAQPPRCNHARAVQLQASQRPAVGSGGRGRVWAGCAPRRPAGVRRAGGERRARGSGAGARLPLPCTLATGMPSDHTQAQPVKPSNHAERSHKPARDGTPRQWREQGPVLAQQLGRVNRARPLAAAAGQRRCCRPPAAARLTRCRCWRSPSACRRPSCTRTSTAASATARCARSRWRRAAARRRSTRWRSSVSGGEGAPVARGCAEPAQSGVARAQGEHPPARPDPPTRKPPPAARRDLATVFKVFDVIRRSTTRHDAVARIAREAAEDFAADGCVLLELRTTPKVPARVWRGGQLLGSLIPTFATAQLPFNPTPTLPRHPEPAAARRDQAQLH
jgi:hypothetical protein